MLQWLRLEGVPPTTLPLFVFYCLVNRPFNMSRKKYSQLQKNIQDNIFTAKYPKSFERTRNDS